MKRVFTINQKLVFFFFLLLFAEGIFLNYTFTILIVIFLSVFIYLINLIFNLSIILKNQKTPPVYSILCPIDNEINALPQFIEAASKLDYPKDKLQIILLLKEDDLDTIKKIEEMLFPVFFKGVVVPAELAKTRSSMVNYGLSYVIGKHTIYDIKDTPDPLRLKKAVLGQNLFTRLFTVKNLLYYI